MQKKYTALVINTLHINQTIRPSIIGNIDHAVVHMCIIHFITKMHIVLSFVIGCQNQTKSLSSIFYYNRIATYFFITEFSENVSIFN